MKLVKIHVPFEKTSGIDLLLHPPAEPEIEIFDELEMKDGFYLMNEYSRNGRDLLQIGVFAPGAEKVIVEEDHKKMVLSKSEKHADLWYHKREIRPENGMGSESCFGMNACGKFLVKSFDGKGHPLERAKVIVLPDMLSYEQYDTMKKEVEGLFKDLAYDEGLGGFFKKTNVFLYPLEPMQELVRQLEYWLQKIAADPSERLIQVKGKVHGWKIKKWHGSAIIKKELYPPSAKIPVRSVKRDTNINEHRMIRKMLEDIQNYVNQAMTIEGMEIQKIRNELEERRENFTFQTADRKNQWIKSGKKEINVSNMMKKRIEELEEELEELERRQKPWQELLEKISQQLEEPLFAPPAMEIEWTHLFASEPSYAAVFDIYEEFLELNPKLASREQELMETLTSSAHLYEVWILFQIIHELRNLQFDCSWVIPSLMAKYNRDSHLEGWSYEFHSKKGAGTFRLDYNVTYGGQGREHLKPDYVLYYRKPGGTTWTGHTLDAKYKPYTKMGEKVLKQDLERSCARYLQLPLDDKNFVIHSSSLVHIDSNICNWNVDRWDLYCVSHFYAVPGDLSNLRIFLKRIIHFFGKQYDLCPSCGNRTDVMEDKHYKQTYICENDHEVWVVNICHNRRKHPFQYRNVKLMKYPADNFNVQVKNEWNVYCPVCHKDAEDHKLKQDIFGPK